MINPHSFHWKAQLRLCSLVRASATYYADLKPYQINKNGLRTFYYGSDHMRYKQVYGERTTYYAGKHFEVEGDISRAYVGDVAVIKYDAVNGDSIRFTLKDRLGSATTLADDQGNIKTLRAFDPFGKPKGSGGEELASPRLSGVLGSNTEISRRGFTDHEHLDDAELIHMNGRVYDYNLGRFMSVDPYIHDGSQGLNPYSYILNNPLSGTDPSGYEPEPEVKPIMERIPGSRRMQQVGETTTQTIVNQETGEVIGKTVVSTYNNGNYSGSITSFENGNQTSVSIFSGNTSNGNFEMLSFDLNSSGQITQNDADFTPKGGAEFPKLDLKEGPSYMGEVVAHATSGEVIPELGAYALGFIDNITMNGFKLLRTSVGIDLSSTESRVTYSAGDDVAKIVGRRGIAKDLVSSFKDFMRGLRIRSRTYSSQSKTNKKMREADRLQEQAKKNAYESGEKQAASDATGEIIGEMDKQLREKNEQN